MSPSDDYIMQLLGQMESLDGNIRPMVDMDQGFRFPNEPRIFEEYVMVYSNGWIYLEFEDHDVGHIWRYDYASIILAIQEAYYDNKIEHENALNYLSIFEAIKEHVRFKKHWYLFDLGYRTLMTLDSFIMYYATEKERVFELPNIVLPDEDEWSVSTWSTHSSDVDDVFIELMGGERIVPTIFENEFDTFFFDLETADGHDVDILWDTTTELDQI